ncbi:type II toxin-antitoxin system HipA family toxin [Myxococcota bacterium]|nr:type II toxin-antitoxin system HipA family toxin [Myxococcota bacterium]
MRVTSLRSLDVRLRFSPDDVREVGVLAERGREVWFEYAPSFIDGGLQLSPLKLPLRAGLQQHTVTAGAPIPGVFNDARPDGWGLKLLHRMFQARGRSASAVSPLDELAYLGQHTMGALCFEPTTGPVGDLHDAVELSALAAHARRVWDDQVSEVLPQLISAGGPSGGARPKALVGLPNDGGPGVVFGEGELPPGFEAWLVKFPMTRDDLDVGRREAAWMTLARAAGLEVPEHRVLALKGVGDAFAARRFDRPGGGQRRHMLSAAGALNADFRTAAADYEHLLRATAVLCGHDHAELVKMFRLAVFNVATVNEDDHLKNFAWILGPEGRWRVAPGYDLTYAPQPQGERATTVAGAGREVRRADLLRLAERVGLPRRAALGVLDEVTAATRDVEAVLQDAGCRGPVSQAAAEATLQATARLVG